MIELFFWVFVEIFNDLLIFGKVKLKVLRKFEKIFLFICNKYKVYIDIEINLELFVKVC